MAGDTEGAVGLTQILAETGQNLLGMHVDVARSAALHAPDRPRDRGRAAPTRAAALQAQAPRGRRPLRPGQGARRHRALPDVRPGGARPRGPRVRLLPHGHRQPAGRARRLRRGRRRPTRGSTSTPRRRATPTSSAGWRASATTPRPTCGSSTRRARSCGCTATTAPELARLEALQTAQELGRGGAAPARRRRRASRRPRRCKAAWDDGDDPRVPERPGAHRPRARRAHGRAGASGSARRPACTAGCGPRRSRWRSTSARRCASSPAATSPLIVTSTVRDEAYQQQLVRRNREATRNYSLHTTGWAFDVARDLRVQAPGARVPVRARPAAGAQRDRLGAGARRDPHHRLARRALARSRCSSASS